MFYPRQISRTICLLVVPSLFLMLTLAFSVSASASPLLEQTIVLTDNIEVLKEKHSLVGSDVINIYIINLQDKIDIVYTHQNGTVLTELVGFSSDLLTLRWYPESHLQISKEGVVIFSSVLHEANYENTAKYLFGKNAQTPELARTNMLLCFISGIILSSIFVYRIVVPLFEDIEIREI